ncbi:MAG: DNA-binding NtrC family response regulator [Halieaceae bacterium]|jgi:DNA-binding NtrC family response regulator
MNDRNRTTQAADSNLVALGGACAEWSVVILFHPDTPRIGQTARVPVGDDSWVLGRHWPVFAGAYAETAPGQNGRQSGAASHNEVAEVPTPAEGRGLEDPRISRRAVRISASAQGWVLERAPGRSRLRANGDTVKGQLDLSAADARAGQLLLLGNRVLLYLRLEQHRGSGDLADGDSSGAGGAPALQELCGVSPAMRRLREEIVRAAHASGDVLLLGPTGTGKELVARAIHRLGAQRSGPWIAVNMAALPAELAAASLFGARRGAYTGADRTRKGYFQEAAGGTLFLDEIGDTPAALQPLLLRALQERELQVVGGAIERVSLRVIAATERDPQGDESTLRAALRFRLGALEIHLAPLRERAEDVGILAARSFAQDARRTGRAWLANTASGGELERWALFFEMLALHDWPGNVRELQHAVAQICAASVDRLECPAHLLERMERAETVAADGPPEAAPRSSMSAITDEQFRAAWRAARYEVSRVARELGVSRSAVYRRLPGLKDCRLAADVPLGELLAMLDECCGDLATVADQLAVSERGLQARLRASGVRLAAADGQPTRSDG